MADKPYGSQPHLKRDDLRRLVEATVPREVAHGWVFHLLFCPLCRKRLEVDFPARGMALLERVRRFRDSLSAKSLATSPPGGRDRLSGGKTSSLLSEYQLCYQEEASAPSLYLELLDHPFLRQEMLVENSQRFRSLGLLKYVLSCARELWHRDAGAAESHARLALAIYRRLDPDRYPSGLVADFGARAWAWLANALRIRGDLPAAEEMMNRASRELENGTGDAIEKAWILQLRISLRRDQRRLREAGTDALRASRLWRSIGERRAEAETVLLHSSILFEAGEATQAIETIRNCLQGLSEAEVGTRLYFMVLQNLAFRLAQTDQPTEASKYVCELRELAAGLGEPLHQIRVDWLEALVDSGLGRRPRAIIRFEHLLRRFMAYEMPYDAALVGLDLAAVHLEEGNSKEARELAGQLVPIFEALQVSREALEALSLFVEALRKEAATVAMVERAHRLLRR